MKSTVLPLMLLLILLSCSSQQKVTTTATPPPPAWVDSRPILNAYYVGIGVAQKSPTLNFQRSARENALSDLASEIKVNVNTNSLLYTLEREYKFEQEFRETINVSSNLDLEDFEIVDSWEDSNSYWVYYRLNKQDYAEKQRKRKESAQNLALDFYAKGLSAQTSHQFNTAADSYLRGLQALEAFWGENNTVDFMGNSIQLDNTLYTALRDLLNNARIVSENPLELNFQNGFKTIASLRVSSSQTNIAYEGAPITYEYFGTYGRFRGKATTNADGRVEIALNEAEKERANNMLIAAIDTEFIFEPFAQDRFMRRLTESMRSNSLQAPITYKAPTIHFNSSEKNLGSAMATSPLSAAIRTSMGRRGVKFSDTASGADLTMTVSADTRKGGNDQGFFTSFLDIDIAVRNNENGQKVYSISRSDLRGVDLDHTQAGMKAYQNLIRNIESEFMRKMFNDIF